MAGRRREAADRSGGRTGEVLDRINRIHEMGIVIGAHKS